MAFAGNTNIRYTGTDAFDTRESVHDAIIDMAPMQVPLLAMMTRGETPAGITHEWRLDYSGAYPSSMGAVRTRGEGEDANPGATAARPAYFNRTHIIGDDWSVSHTEQVVKKFGVASEFDYQAVKHARLVVRDYNFALYNSTIDVDSTGPNTGSAGNKRKMGGLIDLIETPNSYLVSGSPTAATEALGLAATASSSLAISDFTTNLQTVWERGGIPNGVQHFMVSGAAKRIMSELFTPTASSTQIFRRNLAVGGKEVTLPVDVIETDFGFIYVHLDQAVPANKGVGFDPEFFHLNVLRDFETIELAKLGPSIPGMVEAEMTCSLLAPNTGWTLDSIN